MRCLKVVVLGVALACPIACASENGQTGSISYACHEDDCADSQRTFVDRIADLRVPHFVTSACREGNVGPADDVSLGVRHCQCIEADGSVWLIEATGSASFGAGGASPLGDVSPEATTTSVISTEPCLVWGTRGHIACVYPASEAQSCSTSDSHSCEPICARWEQGLTDDAARAYDVALRGSYCWSKDREASSDACLAVVRINDACYATKRHAYYAPTPYDCSLADEAILTLNDSADAGQIP